VDAIQIDFNVCCNSNVVTQYRHKCLTQNTASASDSTRIVQADAGFDSDSESRNLNLPALYAYPNTVCSMSPLMRGSKIFNLVSVLLNTGAEIVWTALQLLTSTKP
jgi:hypothetical protein